MPFKANERGKTMSLVPADVKRAAARGFIRTTAQAYSTALAGGVTVAIVSDAFAQAQAGHWVPLIVSAVVFVFSPLLAGVASFLSITANGLPNDYQSVAGAAYKEQLQRYADDVDQANAG